MTDFDRTTTTRYGHDRDTRTDDRDPAAAGARRRPHAIAASAWVAAGVLIALVVAITGLAAFALTSQTSTSAVLGYVPTDSVAYGELRLDLPATSARRSANSSRSSRASPTRRRSTRSSMRCSIGWCPRAARASRPTAKDVKPWFGGQMGFAAGPIQLGSGEGTAGREHRGLLLLTVKDAALASSWLTATLQAEGVTGTKETYNGGGADRVRRAEDARGAGRVHDRRREGRPSRGPRIGQGRRGHQGRECPRQGRRGGGGPGRGGWRQPRLRLRRHEGAGRSNDRVGSIGGAVRVGDAARSLRDEAHPGLGVGARPRGRRRPPSRQCRAAQGKCSWSR